MSKVKEIQSKIMQLEGGAFQTLFDQYLYKKYKFENIQTLGTQMGSNKPTKGIPDSYVLIEEGKYILINYGTVGSHPEKKIKKDILSCFDSAKLILDEDKIVKIICGHCATNLHIEQFEDIRNSIENVEIELIGIDTISHDLALLYPHLAKTELGVSIDTDQFFEVKDFVNACDANGMNAPIKCEFLHRTKEMDAVCKSIADNVITVLTGPSGIGKTRLAVEVCCRYDREKYKVYCVRSNGNSLYEDIRYYVDSPGNYLIFFDDANTVFSLECVINALLKLPQGYQVKILITVRDYAKERVINTISKYSEYGNVEIGPFEEEEVKDILRTDLGILNYNYLNKIAEIANGNIRLAFLAGLRAVDKGYQAIQNAEDIFRNYYGQILNDSELSKDDIIMLFLIAIAGPIRKNNNELYNKLKSEYMKETDEDRVINRLYSLELIDWFKNEITMVSDQSLGNYILYYVLFEKKWIKIDELITIAFPNYRQKVIYALNTLKELFNSEELNHYMEKGIVAAWDNAPENQENEYLESFYSVNPDKALGIIKRRIDNEKNVDFDLHNFDVEKNKNYQVIKTKEIEILGGYKYTDNFEDALDLLLLYFSKRPDLVMDFYFTITKHLMYDKYSRHGKYRQEAIVLEKLWNASREGENYNNTILYLHIAEYALKTEISYHEETRNSKAIKVIRMPITFDEEIAALRRNIWKIMGVIRRKEEYYLLTNYILTDIRFNGLDGENSRAYLQSDFDAIVLEVLNKKELDFFDAKVIDKYRERANQIRIAIDERYLRANENSDFKIYKMLSREHIIGRTIEEEKRSFRACISQEIRAYELKDYKKLFKTCKYLEGVVSEREQYKLSDGLNMVFELLESDDNMYVNAIMEYFNEDAPLRLRGYAQIDKLLRCIGYEKTYELVSSRNYKDQGRWLCLIWECIKLEDINRKIVNDYKKFIISNIEKENAVVPSIYMLSTYGELDVELKSKVIKKLVERPELSCMFLNAISYDEEEMTMIMKSFQNDMVALVKIYMNVVRANKHIDYEGKLFQKVFEQRPNIWTEYLSWVKDNIWGDGCEQVIFEMIWKSDGWKTYIGRAFNILFYDKMNIFKEQSAQLLFGKTEDMEIMNRKKKWLFDRLSESRGDISKSNLLINIVTTVLPDWKIEYLLEFLKKNKNIDDFKTLYLFPMSESWCGSEIPIIIDKINFLQLLKKELKGIEFLEHREYLEEYCRSLEKYKDEIELREYLENADYA